MTEPMGERGRQGAAPLGGHTPGPWQGITAGVGNRARVLTSDGEWHDADSNSQEPTAVANALVIVAAPELLEALESAVADHVGTEDDCEDDCWSRYARAAISKARGEQ